MGGTQGMEARMAFDELKTPQNIEYKAFATFASRLMTGIDMSGNYLQLKTNNLPTSSTDNSKYRIDATITINGDQIGVLDVERKTEWAGGGWPYPKINIPYRPGDCFFDGKDGDGRFSSKYCGLRKAWVEGSLGFWVAYTAPISDTTGQQTFVSRQACLIVPADNIFGGQFGARTFSQPTKYHRADKSRIHVDVVQLQNEAGITCFSEDEFTSVIVNSVADYLESQEGKA